MLRVVARLNVGGPAIHTILLTAGLQDDRFRSTLVTGVEGKSEGSMLHLARKRGVAPLVLPALGREIDPRSDLRCVYQLWRLMRRLRPQIVHTHTAKAGTVGRVAARLAGVPIVVHTFHGHVFHGYFGPIATRTFLSIERGLGRLTDRTLAVSESQRRELARYGVAPWEQIEVMPLGLELERFTHCEARRGELRAELGLPSDAPLVGIVARLVPIKDHDTFLRACRRVADRLPAARFLVVGDGERRGEIEALAGTLGLGDRTLFLGWRHDLDRLYADVDVVALTSRNEGLPVAVIEAMASARPVVATRVGGVPDLVRDGATGLLAPPGDTGAIANALLRLLEDSHLAARMGQAGREAAYPRYTSGRLVANVRDLYERLLAEKGVKG